MNASNDWVSSNAVIGNSTVQGKNDIAAIYPGKNSSFESGELSLGDNLSTSGNYAVFGHDGGTGITTTQKPSNTNYANFHRLSRIWYIDDHGGLSPDMTFDLINKTISGADASSYVLLYRSGTSGSFTEEISGADKVNGAEVKFNNVSIKNGYYTIGIKEAYYVSTSGSNTNAGTISFPFHTVDHAINQSSSNALIHLKQGTYNNSTTATIDKSVTISSGLGTKINDLKLDGTNVNAVLEDPLKITSTLNLQNGTLSIPETSDSLVLEDGATVKGANGSSYVNGKVTKIGDDAFTFPLGGGGRLAEIGISDPGNNTSVKFTAQYTNSGYGNTSKGSGLAKVSTIEYWTLDEVSSNTPSVKVTLHWENASNQGISTPSDLKVAHWTGSQWKDEGRSSYSSSSGSGSVTSNSMSSFSPMTFGSSTNNNALPVELTHFSGQKQPGQVKLKWHTASEQNASHFLVQRSEDGEQFQTIGRKEAQGTTTESTHYQYFDRNPEMATNYYRLKQVDFDGSYEYSNVISVNFNEEVQQPSLKIRPNPLKDQLNIHSPKSQISNYKLQTLTGRTIQSGKLPGQGRHTVDVSDLSAGVYLLNVKTDEAVRTKKVIVK